MPTQVLTNVENNFTKGLITEFTGLNFPENAATDCDNVEFTLVGDVNRRLGINYETNHASTAISHVLKAVATYKWGNAGGDGLTEVVVSQIGSTLRFYKSSLATTGAPVSTQLLASTVDLSAFAVAGTVIDSSVECEFSDGNGYLFVYHSSCDPIYCTIVGSTVAAYTIDLKIRDFTGVIDFSAVTSTTRPTTLTETHSYNLQNQGWLAGNAWSQFSGSTNTITVAAGKAFTVAAGLTAAPGDLVTVYFNRLAGFGRTDYVLAAAATITAYAATTMTMTFTSVNGAYGTVSSSDWYLVSNSAPYISTWFGAIGNYPSNADVWWYFKNAAGTFDPATTVSKVTIGSTAAPRGHFIVSALSQLKATVSSLTTITNIIATKRPRTGTWFAGRVWYTGIDSVQAATGNADNYSWAENIYFSQIVNSPLDFGKCHQLNDPTSETLFDLLPTDGGVISIQGCGSIYKLFPIQNSLLVFASNGIWYITGSSGIGFAANDYTIYKLSGVRSISGTSIVNVNGFPFFWNEEGIYSVTAGKQGNEPDSRRNALEVNPITVGTILSFYESIPASSKRHARGVYDPISYVIRWIYRSGEEGSVTQRYQYDKILNFNTYNNAFYPYTVGSTVTGDYISSIIYLSNPGGLAAPAPTVKYYSYNLTSSATSFAEMYDTTYEDWGSADYTSYFITGYKLHGQGQRRFQLPYIYVFSRADEPTSYKVQGLWDYAITGDSGRWSVAQLVNNWSPNFGMIVRRHRIRGQGIVLQLKVSSSTGQPFDIMGWSAFETQNTGI